VSKQSGTGFDLPSKLRLRQELEDQMAQPGFWDAPETAQRVVSQISSLKSIPSPLNIDG